ncbi:MAG TPA: methyl-accepting chemotaxis protein [Mobilitalea sp.]|nr:methyl-accepting chemotaxis protein [Mobilitalea sp.]
MKSLKTKLVVAFSVLIFIITTIIGSISLINSYRSLRGESQESLGLMAAEGARVTESRMETLITTMELIAKKKEIVNMGWEVDLAVLKEELNKTDFLDIGFVLPNGYTYYTDGTVRLMSDRAYVQKALEGNSMMSDVIISRVTRKPEIEIAVPVVKDGDIVGAIVGRRNADALGVIIKDEGYGKNGYAYMMNSEGRLIAYPDNQLVINRFNPMEAAKTDQKQASLAKAFEYMLKKQTGFTSYQLEGITYYAGFAPINGTDWIYVITADKDEVLNVLPKMIQSMILVMLIVLFLSVGAVYIMDLTITRPLIGMTKVSKKLAVLDLRENIAKTYLDQKDEIGTLSGAFQALILRLREIISMLTEAANQVTATSQELTASSLQSALASEEISRTVEEIARGASEQANSTESGSAYALQLEKMIEKNHEHIMSLNKASDNVNKSVSSGLTDIEKLTSITKENEKVMDEICDIITKTKLSSEQIGEASRVISEIARQTNLLALNATIEASRAGEAGRGFSVVADEIQKMADQSAASTKYIDNIVAELQGNAKKAFSQVKLISKASEEQHKSVAATMERYQSIAESMKVSEDVVKVLNGSEVDMNHVKNEILTMLQALAAVAEQNAAGTQQAASAMEEQTASAKELAGASDRLSELAGNLQTITMKFQV